VFVIVLGGLAEQEVVRSTVGVCQKGKKGKKSRKGRKGIEN
jgi:hypothetical protein